MAKSTFQVATWTPVAVADAAAMTNGGFMALQGGSGTQINEIKEIYMGGQATVQSPTIMLVGRDSTVGGTPTALATPNSNGPLHPSSVASSAVGMIAATTPPQRSNSTSLSKLNLSFNAFGGIVRWYTGDDEEFIILGNTASLGEASLSAFTGGTPGLMGAHIVFETR